MIRAGAVTLVAVLCAACVSSGTTECPDRTLCSDGTSCVMVSSGAYQCASDDQLAACKHIDDGTTCSVGANHGTCFGGGCIIAACGDGVQDADPSVEACDDGNKVAGDGCSADCTSAETCGNSIIDLAAGEECDDGGTTFSGDGCTGHCKREYRIWRDVTPHPPATRTGFGFATDPIHGTTLIGGGVVTIDTSNTLVSVFDDTWHWDGTTWIEALPPVVQSARFEAATAYDARRDRVVMFGGLGNSGSATATTWEWDGVTWRDRATAVKPGPRSGGAMACNHTECVLFGGIKSATALADTWLWNGTTWTEKVVAVPPLARTKASMAYDPNLDQIVMHGGTTASGARFSDVWVYANNTWTFKSTGASFSQSSLAFDPVRNKIVFVDASNTGVLDPATYVFTMFNGGPPAMTNAQIAWDPDQQRIVAVGPAVISNDLVMATLNAPPGNAWALVTEVRPSGGANRVPAAFDPRRGTTIVLDTVTGTSEWTGRGWTFRAAPGANTKDGVSLAHDPTCGVTLSFAGGGATPTGVRSNDVYRFPDAMGNPEWTQLAPSGTLPPVRTRQAMTYDADRHVFVVFGGYVTGADVNARDTWELSSANCTTWTWTERTPASGPPARYDAQLAYDPVRKVTVLFGGQNLSGTTSTSLADTWEWNGTAWTQRMPMTSPPARFNHGMAVDPRRHRIVLFGGRSDDGNYNDTWEWDGTGTGTWTLLAPAVVPSARNGMGFAPDVTGGLISINGNAGGNTFVNVQRLTSELSTDRVDACQDATIDSDGDGAKGCADPDCWTRCALCGNAICDPGEDYLLCPADCMAPPP